MKGLVSFFRQDRKRFVWEVVVAAGLVATTWLVCGYVYGRSNQVCMDEAEAMRQQWLVQQAEMDKAIYEGRLSEKALELSEKDAQISALEVKMASDSIAHLSELAAVRAINQYIKKR